MDHVDSVRSFLLLIIFLTTVLILVPLCSRWIHQLYQHKYEMFMQKRRPSTTILLNVSLMTSVVCLQAVLLDVAPDPIVDVILLVECVSYASFMGCLLCKSWILYYDYKWTYYTLSSEWVRILDASPGYKASWFMQHKSTYGNYVWVTRRVAVMTFCCGILTQASFILLYNHESVLEEDYYRVMGAIFFFAGSLPLTASYVLMVYKTPMAEKFNDGFYIHWESKRLCKLVVANFILLTNLCLAAAFGSDDNLTRKTVFQFVAMLSSSGLLVAVVYTLTRGVITRNEGNCTCVKDRNIIEASTRSTQKRSGMAEVMSYKRTLHLFMTHLSKEYSMELLLSYIEFSQYLEYYLHAGASSLVSPVSTDCIAQSADSTQARTMPHSSFMFTTFPESIPMSSIIDKEDDDHDWKLKAHALYKKYVARGSEYEINISYALRIAMAGAMESLISSSETEIEPSVTDVSRLFSECNNQMYTLLDYSYGRFVLTDEYKKVINLLAMK